MKLKRYCEPGIQEKSWTWIGCSALFRWITPEVISLHNNFVQIATSLVSMCETVLTSELGTDEINEFTIHINSLPKYKNFGAKFYRDERQPYIKHGLFTVSKLLLDLIPIGLSLDYCDVNSSRLPLSLIVLSIDVIEKLSFSKKHELNYTNWSPMWPFHGNFFGDGLSIKWVGEADKDGDCECVIVDDQGNTYKDIWLDPYYTTYTPPKVYYM